MTTPRIRSQPFWKKIYVSMRCSPEGKRRGNGLIHLHASMVSQPRHSVQTRPNDPYGRDSEDVVTLLDKGPSEHPQPRRGAMGRSSVGGVCPRSIHVAGSDPYDLNRDGDGVAFIDRGGRSPTLLIEEVALRPTLQDLKFVGLPALQLKARVAVLDIHQARWSTRQASTALAVQHRIRCQPRLREGRSPRSAQLPAHCDA